jgi:hypothetical protein
MILEAEQPPDDDFDRAVAAARAFVEVCANTEASARNGWKGAIALAIHALCTVVEDQPTFQDEDFPVGLGLAIGNIFADRKDIPSPGQIRSMMNSLTSIVMGTVIQIAKARAAAGVTIQSGPTKH